MKLLRFLLLICMMQSLGVMAQSKKPNTNSSEANSPKIDTEILARHRRSEAHRPAEIDANAITYPAESVKQNFLRPPTSISTLIDNSPVKEKSTIESAISPENNSFGLEYILESFKPIEFCINKPKPYDFCFSVERIFRNTKANFDILDKFNISMSINDIVKQCKYKGRDSNSNPLFNCDNEKIGNNGFITLAIIYYPKVKAINIRTIEYYTCSPPWVDVKPLIIKKYEPQSFRYLETMSTYNSIRFLANVKESEVLYVSHSGGANSCPGGQSLYIALTNSNRFDKESAELYKKISEDTAKKTPIPKF